MSYAKWRDVEKDANVSTFGGFEHHKRFSKVSTIVRESLIGDKDEALEEIRFRFTRVLNRVYWEIYE